MFSQKEISSFQKDFWRNKSYCRIIFPEADRGTLQNIRRSTFHATKLDCLLTLATVAKSSILDMAAILKPRVITKTNINRDH